MFTTSKRHIVSALLAATLLAGCSTLGLSGPQVAKVNDAVITQKEFQESYTRILRAMNLDPKKLESEENQPLVQMFQKITLQNLILSALVEEEAVKRKLEVTDAEVQAAYEKYVDDLGGEKEMQKQLTEPGFNKNDLKRLLRDQLLRDKLIQAIAGNTITVSESEALKFYKNHTAEFDRPEQVQARHILVSADPTQIRNDLAALKKDQSPEALEQQIQTAMAEKRKKAESLLAQARMNPDQFEALAGKHSDDSGSAENGGDLGYFSREAMVPTFSEAAFSTKPGQIHDAVVTTPFGYHIIQIVDRRAAEKKSFEDVKSQIITMLENQKKAEFMQSWLNETKKKAKIELAPEFAFVEENAGEASSSAAPSKAVPAKKRS